jgi:hypothetical protein
MIYMATETHKNNEAFNALLMTNWIGKLVKCEKDTGKMFTAKLVAVRGNHLLFENKRGSILMDSISSLKTAAPLARYEEFMDDISKAEEVREAEQFKDDDKHFVEWVEGEMAKGHAPSEPVKIAEVNRYCNDPKTIVTYEEAARRRKGI